MGVRRLRHLQEDWCWFGEIPFAAMRSLPTTGDGTFALRRWYVETYNRAVQPNLSRNQTLGELPIRIRQKSMGKTHHSPVLSPLPRPLLSLDVLPAAAEAKLEMNGEGAMIQDIPQISDQECVIGWVQKLYGLGASEVRLEDV